HQPRESDQPRRADRQARGAVRLRGRRALALGAGHGRRPGRQGALDGRRLLVGADALPGVVAVGLAPDVGLDRPARLPAALRRQRPLRRPRRPRGAADARPAQRVDPGVARLVTRDWHEWHASYADPESSLSRRAEVVRAELAALLAAAPGPV